MVFCFTSAIVARHSGHFIILSFCVDHGHTLQEYGSRDVISLQAATGLVSWNGSLLEMNESFIGTHYFWTKSEVIQQIVHPRELHFFRSVAPSTEQGRTSYGGVLRPPPFTYTYQAVSSGWVTCSFLIFNTVFSINRIYYWINHYIGMYLFASMKFRFICGE